ncbi:MAG: LacI family DNA-binding transcriptional regulator [Butyricicoccus sp.]
MTVTEIAQRAGVSKACVSRYFNHGYVSEEKKEKIRQVVAETGYVPNRGTQAITASKKRTIGVVIPKINSESMSRMVAGISQVLYREGYRMLLANTENSIEKELLYLQSFQQDNLEGLIFTATIFTKAHAELLRSINVPIVVLGQESEEYSCVYHDDYGAAKAMADRIVGSGRTKVGAVLVTQDDRAAGEQRCRGFMDALREAGIPIEKQRIVRSEFTLESGYDAAQKLMEQAPDTDAIFCATDTIAIGVMQYLKGIGKKIPQDVAVSGIGHSRMTEIIEPNLTTAHLFYKTTGMEGADMLIKMIQTGIDMKKKLKMGYEVVEQETV